MNYRLSTRLGVVSVVLGSLLASAAAPAQAPVARVTETSLEALLTAAHWSERADDDLHGEQLSTSSVSLLATGAGASKPTSDQLGGLGVLVLALSVAEWGVKADDTQQVTQQDPAKHNWSGPKMLGGKHLMSYTAGGIGIPHLDVGDAIPFFDELARLLPAAGPVAAELRHAGQDGSVFHYDVVRAQGGICSTAKPKPTKLIDLDGEPFSDVAESYAGPKYCQRFNSSSRLDPERWQRLRHWSRVGLRRRDIQAWIVGDWVAHRWMPAYLEVSSRPEGTLAEAFIIARIRNSSPALAQAALKAAGSATDPTRRIMAELARYARGSETNRCRAGVMQRPAAMLGLTVVPTDNDGCLPRSMVSDQR